MTNWYDRDTGPNPDEAGDLRGIRRFHKLTITLGIVFCLLMFVTYFRGYHAHEEPRYTLYMGLSAAGAAALSTYLYVFCKRGF